MTIPFTQYLRPDGRTVQVTFNRPEEIEEKALAITAQGYRFECEVLITGHVSLTITNDEDGDVSIELSPLGTDYLPFVDKLIERFHESLP